MRADDRSAVARTIELLLERTKTDTMRRIYERLAPGSDGRIRTFQAPITETGRLNSKGSDWFPEASTNLQNLPKKTAKASPLYQVRSVIVPDPGRVFLFADLAQAELYAYLAFAGDWDRLARLEQGSDEHRRLASAIFDVDESAVTSVQRDIAKMGNYLLGYGGGWNMFMGQVNKDADLTGIAINAKLARRVVDVWRESNPLTVAWWEEQKEEVARVGYLRTPSGRRRDFLRVGDAGNDIIAHGPQNLVADHLNARLADVYEQHDPHLVRVLLQVHDEIFCDAAAEDLGKAARALKHTMTKPVLVNGREITIPVDIEYSLFSWQDKKEWADG